MSSINNHGDPGQCSLCIGYLTTQVVCKPPLSSTTNLSIVAFMPSSQATGLPVVSQHMLSPLNDTDLAQLLHSSMGQNQCTAVISLPRNRFATLETLTGTRSMVLSVLHDNVIPHITDKTTLA